MPKHVNLKAENASPAEAAAAVTPSDSGSLEGRVRALYIGTGGVVSVKMADGSSVTFSGVPSGFILPVTVAQVLATGTTASGIVALY